MSKKILKINDVNSKVVYAQEFGVELPDGTVLDATAKHTLHNSNLMVKLDGDLNEVERRDIYIEIAKDLFVFEHEGQDVTESVSDETLTSTFVMYIENFAEDVKRNIGKPSSSPKGLQSKRPTKGHQPSRVY